MKIRCRCGDVVVDTTDFLGNKARLVADEDWFDVLEDARTDDGDSLLLVASRPLWQCESCGRLYVDDHTGTPRVFVPEGEPPAVGLLRSHVLDAWRRPLVGTWRTDRSSAPPGELWWGGSDAEQGLEDFAEWSALERRYHEVFSRLRDRDLLRSAFLRRDGETLHVWPERPGTDGRPA